MKMSDVKVGMRLRATLSGSPGTGRDPWSLITVTELKERGFKYRLDAPVVVHPRLGIIFAEDGHEHFGYNGEAFYEPVRENRP
jgi:hypothetical protein